MDDFMNPIDGYSDTSIRDKKLIDFLNNLKSKKLRKILRNYLEDKCFFEQYTYDDLKRDFKNHIENDKNKYFLPDFNDRLEDILYTLLLKYDVEDTIYGN